MKFTYLVEKLVMADSIEDAIKREAVVKPYYVGLKPEDAENQCIELCEKEESSKEIGFRSIK